MNKSNPANVYYPSDASSRLDGRMGRPVTASVGGSGRRTGEKGATFRHAYRRWSLAHAATLVALVALAEVPVLRGTVLLVLGGWTVAATLLLYGMGARVHPDGPGPVLPNALTGSRFVVAALLFVFVALTLRLPATADAI
ncbi:MAG: hypothetical protein ACOC1U_08655, partial [Spirochaetota bacterium]